MARGGRSSGGRDEKRSVTPKHAPKQDRGCEFSQRELERFLAKARRAAGLKGPVGLLLADDATLRMLNCNYRQKNEPTDVLSFPAGGPVAGGRLAGDLAISVETAQRQAEEHGHTLASELKILVLHGVLHLSGHDHERDDGAMERLERRLRRELGLPAGLIERAGAEGERILKTGKKGDGKNLKQRKEKYTQVQQRQVTKRPSTGGQR